MLRFLRKYSASKTFKIVFGLLVLSFLGWGVGTVGGDRTDVVATVRGEPITRREVQKTALELQERYERLFKDRFSGDLARSLDLPARALEQLIDEALLQHEADRLGMAVTDAEVDGYITHLPDLQEDGRFSRAILERFLESNRDRGEFEDSVRRSLLFDRMRALVVDGVQVSDGELEARYRLDHEQVQLAFVRVKAADLAQAVTLTDEDLERYLAGHADTYRTSERVRVRYVAYRANDYGSQIEPTDGEINEYYELEKDGRFTDPEQVRARHILVAAAAGAKEDIKAAARKKAEDLLAQVRAGGDFAALAKQHSEDPGSATNGGDLGLFPRGRMAPPFESAAFALEPGQVSEVVETTFGFHIIKSEERRAAGPRPLEAVREEIVKALRHDRGLARARSDAEADRRAIVKGTPFAEALASRSVAETPLFGANEAIPGVGRVPGFSDAAFGLGTGEVSDLLETDDAIYVLTPFERSEAHVPPLAEVRDRVAADARRARGEAVAKEKAEQIRTRAAAVGLETAAAEAGATAEQTDPFDRKVGAIPKLGPVSDLRTEAFALTTDAPIGPKVYSAGGDAVVVALQQRLAADMSGFATERERLAPGVLQEKKQSMHTAFMSYLKERAVQDGAFEVQRDAADRG